MSKVGIITLFGYQNFGNRLQNYAVQEILSEMGYSSTTIVCNRSLCRDILKYIRDFFMTILGNTQAKKRMAFRRFVKRTTKTKKIYENNGQIPVNISKKFDYFVTGSDQVWNPEVRRKDFYNFFLKFANTDQRVCISPSIAVQSIKKEDRDIMIDGLEGFRHLCCREQRGAQIITELTGRKVEVLIDPTMYLEKNKWHKLYKKKINLPQKPYVLIFFLGHIPDDRKEKISSVAKEHNADVINIQDQHSKYYTSDPSEFLQLLEGALLVCTDSFHGTAFSINFNKPFYTFKRIDDQDVGNNMYSRLENLLKMFGVEERNEEHFYLECDVNCDFSAANERLEYERKKMSNFLTISFS